MKKKRRNKKRTLNIIVTILIVCVCILAAAGVFFVHSHFGSNNNAETENVVKDDVENNETENNKTELSTEQQVEKLLDSLTLEEKVAQLFIITPEQLTPEYNPVIAAGDATKAAFDNYPVGGIIYLEQNLVSPDQTKTMLTNIQKYSMDRLNIPMFLCSDEEGGQVSRLANNKGFDVPVFGNMSEIGKSGDIKKAENVGKTIGTYLSDYGFNTDFAPVADILLNEDNQVVKVRAFGEEPDIVTKMAGAVNKGLRSENILTSYKHFPGHGDTTADTHEGYAFSNKTLEEMYECELIPFIDGIKNNVPFMMVDHISCPNIIGDNTPASLSKVVINDLLIEELGYNGIVITDALNMGAISKEYSSSEAALKAIEAGVDMILMPENFNEAYDGIIKAVKNGTISEERINKSVYKIMNTKLTIL